MEFLEKTVNGKTLRFLNTEAFDHEDWVTLSASVAQERNVCLSLSDLDKLPCFSSPEALLLTGGSPGSAGFAPLYQSLSNEQYLEIMAKLKLSGKVGFVIRTVDVGDHVTLTDGTDIGPFIGGELDGYTVLVPQNGLPDLAKGRDKLDLTFHVKTYEAYIWLEGDQVYSYFPVIAGVPVTFEIRNSAAD